MVFSSSTVGVSSTKSKRKLALNRVDKSIFAEISICEGNLIACIIYTLLIEYTIGISCTDASFTPYYTLPYCNRVRMPVIASILVLGIFHVFHDHIISVLCLAYILHCLLNLQWKYGWRNSMNRVLVQSRQSRQQAEVLYSCSTPRKPRCLSWNTGVSCCDECVYVCIVCPSPTA